MAGRRLALAAALAAGVAWDARAADGLEGLWAMAEAGLHACEIVPGGDGVMRVTRHRLDVSEIHCAFGATAPAAFAGVSGLMTCMVEGEFIEIDVDARLLADGVAVVSFDGGPPGVFGRQDAASLARECGEQAPAGRAGVEMPRGRLIVERDAALGEVVVSAGGLRIGLGRALMPEPVVRVGDSVLLRMASDGTDCPALHAWVTLDGDGLRATPPFGTCSDIGVVEAIGGRPTLVTPRLGARGLAGFAFDGRGVSEVAIRR